MILELHRQGLKVAAIARQLGIDRKTVRKYISRGLEPPTYGPRPHRQKSTDPFLPYLRERLVAFPGLTAVRLWREMRERGYAGGYTAVKRAVRDIRPDPVTPFEVRFETPPGEQAQVDLARFEVEFTDEPGVTRIVWLFSMVRGYSRLIWARCVPREILYDRMKTAAIGEDPDGLVVYNRALLDLARHYAFQPRACRPYRPKTKGKVERPFRYIREDFFLGASFRNLDDLNVSPQQAEMAPMISTPRESSGTVRDIAAMRAAWLAEWKPKLTSNEKPFSPYRVNWDLLHHSRCRQHHHHPRSGQHTRSAFRRSGVTREPLTYHRMGQDDPAWLRARPRHGGQARRSRASRARGSTRSLRSGRDARGPRCTVTKFDHFFGAAHDFLRQHRHTQKTLAVAPQDRSLFPISA
jgi:transposase